MALTTQTEQMTPAQKKLYEFVLANPGSKCEQIARHMWPDSRSWEPGRRVGRWKSLPASCVLIMKAGAMCQKLWNLGWLYTMDGKCAYYAYKQRIDRSK